MVNANGDATPLEVPAIRTVFGVDFSGAARSGKTAWQARFQVADDTGVLRLTDLQPLGRLAQSDDRNAVCSALVRSVTESDAALWGMDFPFGLPVELDQGDWLTLIRRIDEYPGTAKDYGRHLVELTKRFDGSMHIRRLTDRESKTPFDCYHYRIIYQTFHGIRDVLGGLAGDPTTAVLPFSYDRLTSARRIVVEACPSSTLKRLRLPYRHYKQSGGKPPTAVHRDTRRQILGGIDSSIEMSRHRRRVMMSDSGGDALDAVLAGLGSWQAVRAVDHQMIATHPRYPREGYVYA